MPDDDETDRHEVDHPAVVVENRLVEFAVRVIRVSASLPKDDVGRHLAKQIMRSGTSPAANYAEARSAESRPDFIHKLKIVLKELNETHVWLKIITKSKLLTNERLIPLIAENNELCKMINASITTARANLKP